MRDILGEYSQFKIFQTLEQAGRLASTRAQIPSQQYLESAAGLRRWALSVLDGSKIEKYPDDLQKFLKKSGYSSALPEYLARVILNGFPDDMNLAISSSEIGLYDQLARTLHAELKALDTAAKKLNIEEIVVPDDEVSLDVIVPRNIFENDASRYLHIVSKFSSILSRLTELTTGSKGSPTLIYTSTSDPVTGLAVQGAAAWAFLRLYKLFLEVAEKQISLLKTIKEFRASPLNPSGDFEERVKAIVTDAIRDSLDQAFESVASKVAVERAHEIKNGVDKDARIVVQAIANGARVGITIECLDRLNIISAAVPELALEAIEEEIKQQKALEYQVSQSFAFLGEPAPALLLSDSVVSE